MGMGGGFLQRWYDANAPRGSRYGSTNPRHMYGTDHDRSQRVRRHNGYGGGIGDYRPKGGPEWKPTPGAGFSYQGNPQPPGQPSGQPNQSGGNQSQSSNPFQAGYYSNLENGLPLPQGWQTPWSMPTSVSSLITNLLYTSRQDPLDVWGSVMGGSRSSNKTYSGGTSYGSYGGQSGYDNRGTGYGSSSANSSNSLMSQSSYDALALADAYFAPKRLELAYQLGDMETDMKRLAVNLGRQIDDPILQAKLYKEAMKSVRTLDADQNSFALQMLEQRRKEEVQNQQFYAQLALEADKMQQQDDQFYASLELQRRQVSLQARQVNAQLSQMGG